MHPLRTGTNSWRAVLVLPTEALAREVWENLQPLGPLEVQPDHWTGGELFEVTAPGDGTYTGYFTVGRVRPQADARSEFPTGAHIGRNNDSIVVTHDNVDLHHVLYYAGNFGSSSSGWQNAKTHSWVDEGAIKLKNGRTFGYRRIALYPDELIVNGARYDLRKGRVFVLNDDGLKEQLSLTVSLSTAKDPIALGALIARHGVGTPAPPVKITPAVKIARQPAPTPVKVTKGVNNGISNILTDNTSATFDAQVKVGEALRVFIGDDYPGWSTMPVKSGPISVIVKASSQIRLDDGSLGRGFTIKTDGGTVYVAITPDGPVPFGELIFRTADKVTAKSGNHTFADIRKPDGTLVPVCVCVRRVPSSPK